LSTLPIVWLFYDRFPSQCFSAVVGPNGSGKSNVIDAMLFVFGKRAKQMRQSKVFVFLTLRLRTHSLSFRLPSPAFAPQVSQLIHSSKDFPSLELASVTVHFSFIQDGEGEDFTVIEGSEFTIKRTAHDDNSSNYYLNGKRSGYKEITEKVMEVGIDLTTSRFLILQVRDDNTLLLLFRSAPPSTKH